MQKLLNNLVQANRIGAYIVFGIVLLLLAFWILTKYQPIQPTQSQFGGGDCYKPNTDTIANNLALLQTIEDADLDIRNRQNNVVSNIERAKVIGDIIGPGVFSSNNDNIYVGPNTNCTNRPTCKTPPNIATSMMYTSTLPRSLTGPGKADDAYFSSQTTPNPFNPPCLTGAPYGNSMATYNYWKLLPKLLQLQYTDCDKYQCSTTSQNGYTALPNLDFISASNSGASGLSALSGQGGIAAPLGGPTLACDPVNQDYYNSSEDFCRTHPEHYPCPNWWMNNSPQIRDVTRIPGYECLTQYGAQSPTHNTCKGGIFTNQAELNRETVDQSLRDLNREKIDQTSPFGISTYSQKEKFPGFCLATDPNCKLDDGQGILAIKRGREDQGLC